MTISAAGPQPYSRVERRDRMDEFWPITHGAYAHVTPLMDTGGIFSLAAQAVFNHPAAEFDALMREVLIKEDVSR